MNLLHFPWGAGAERHLQSRFFGIYSQIDENSDSTGRQTDQGQQIGTMKIEKINDNQIRCTLTRADLEERHIRLGELAYGTEKAKMLFREMMSRACRECGWTNEANIPLMIEAIPDRENSLILVITKVEDPEELDTRFAKFTATDVLPDGEDEVKVEGADDVLDVFRKFFDQKKKGAKAKSGVKAPSGQGRNPQGPKSQEGENRDSLVLTRIYRFRDLNAAISAAAALRGFFRGESTLFRTKKDGGYVLVVRQSPHTPEEFNKICNILSEYGRGENYTPALEAGLAEYEQTVIRKSAVQELAGIAGND